MHAKPEAESVESGWRELLRRPWFLAAASLAVATIVLAVRARAYYPFVADDALISLRYSQNILDGHGIVWNPGERAEGYSNLLWVLLAAGLGALGMDLIVASRVLGIASTMGLFAAMIYARPPRNVRDAALTTGALATIAASGPIVVWAIGGLESPLVVALLAWALVLLQPTIVAGGPPRAMVLPGVLLGLACLTRLDAIVLSGTVVAGFLAAVLASRGFQIKSLLRPATIKATLVLGGIPVATVVGQLVFRVAYYGQWVPNTALAKVAFTPARLGTGISYVGSAALWLLPLGAAAVAIIVMGLRRPDDRARILLLATPMALWTAYVVVLGGDIFPARRHMAPVVGVAGLVLVEWLRWSRSPDATRAPMVKWQPAAVALLFIVVAVSQAQDPMNQRAALERWEYDGQVLANLFRDAFGHEDPLLAVTAAGALPYFSGLRSLDGLGLNDPYLPHHRPENFGQGDIGHELGDADYVLERKPDIMTFCFPPGRYAPCYPHEYQLVEMEEFWDLYRGVRMRGDDPYTFEAPIYLRAEDSRIGVQRGADEVLVPAYLMNGNRDTVAFLHDGALVIEAAPGVPASIEALQLPAGSWEIVVDASGPVQIAAGTNASRLPAPAASASISLTDPGHVVLEVSARDTVQIRTISLQRSSP